MVLPVTRKRLKSGSVFCCFQFDFSSTLHVWIFLTGKVMFALSGVNLKFQHKHCLLLHNKDARVACGWECCCTLSGFPLCFSVLLGKDIKYEVMSRPNFSILQHYAWLIRRSHSVSRLIYIQGKALDHLSDRCRVQPQILYFHL